MPIMEWDPTPTGERPYTPGTITIDPNASLTKPKKKKPKKLGKAKLKTVPVKSRRSGTQEK